MKNIESIQGYIDGTMFSSGLKIFTGSENHEEKTRISALKELLRDKRIIHLGCTDHLPLIQEKIERNMWLHGILDEYCTECFGIDISEGAIAYLKTKLGYKNICCADILEEDVLKDKTGTWDYLLLGEILEHVDNPVSFLAAIHANYAGRIQKIVITVPNALNLYFARNVKRGIEHVNTDHRYWFTPFTLLKVVNRSGFKNTELTYVNRIPLTFAERIIRKFKKMSSIRLKYPKCYFDTLLVTADFNDKYHLLCKPTPEHTEV